MNQSEQDGSTVQEPFSSTVDQYGGLWLHAQLEGQQVAIDLADKNRAFQIIAATMADHRYEYSPAKPRHDGQADNDDELRR
jgi:hypothetical protein